MKCLLLPGRENSKFLMLNARNSLLLEEVTYKEGRVEDEESLEIKWFLIKKSECSKEVLTRKKESQTW